jgi:hypothetical protein
MARPFRDRTDAGQQLAAQLTAYAKRPDVLIADSTSRVARVLKQSYNNLHTRPPLFVPPRHTSGASVGFAKESARRRPGEMPHTMHQGGETT